MSKNENIQVMVESMLKIGLKKKKYAENALEKIS